MTGLRRKGLLDQVKAISQKQQKTDPLNINIYSKEKIMRRFMIIALAVTLFLIPGISGAQMRGGGKGQGMGGQQMHQGGQGMMGQQTYQGEQETGRMGPGMHAHMAQMGEMMNKLSQMMGNWRQMTPEQHQEMVNIMNQMSQMMQNISMAQGGQLKPEQQQELNQTQKSLDSLYDHVGH